jgi:hypothetical protein
MNRKKRRRIRQGLGRGGGDKEEKKRRRVT